MKKIFPGFLFLVFVFLFPPITKAQLVINELGVKGNEDWVEVINIGNITINTNEYMFKDNSNSGNTLYQNTTVGPGSIVTFEWGNSLNVDGDIVRLIRVSDQQIIEEIKYGNMGGVCLPETESGSIGKTTDGGNVMERFSKSSKTLTNSSGILSPCPAPTVLATSSTPRPTTQPKASYKINQPKDQSGNPLSNVKIYLNGDYTNHYAPETFDFCSSGCDHGFGYYTFRLEKSGYENWQEGKDIKSGDGFEVNPVMNSASTQTSTPQPSASASPSPTAKSTPKSTSDPNATPFITIVNEEATTSASTDNSGVLGEVSEPSPTPIVSKFSRKKILSWSFIAVGMGFLGFSGYSFVRKMKEYGKKQNKIEIPEAL